MGTNKHASYPGCVIELFNLYNKRILPPLRKSHEDIRLFVAKLLDCLNLSYDEQYHEIRVKDGKADIYIPGRLILEVKTDLADREHIRDGKNKLLRYAKHLGSDLGVLTDGRRWYFYYISEKELREYDKIVLPNKLDEFYEVLVNKLARLMVRIPGKEMPTIDKILSDFSVKSYLYRKIRSSISTRILCYIPRIYRLIGIWAAIYKKLYPGLENVARTLSLEIDKDLGSEEKEAYNKIGEYLMKHRIVKSPSEARGIIEIFLRHMYYDLLLRVIATVILSPEAINITSILDLLNIWKKRTTIAHIFKYNTIYMEAWRDIARWRGQEADAIVDLIMEHVKVYDWLKTEPDVFRELYENLLPQELRHQIGEYYTPDDVIDATLTLLKRTYKELGMEINWQSKKVLDPACGSGGFLVKVLEKKLSDISSKIDSTNNIVAKLKTIVDVVSTITGFDINPIAVTTARLLVLLKVIDYIRRKGIGSIPLIDIDIHIADALSPISLTSLGTYNLYVASGIAVLLPKYIDKKNYEKYLEYIGTVAKKAEKLLINRSIRIECIDIVSNALNQALKYGGETISKNLEINECFRELRSIMRNMGYRYSDSLWNLALQTILLNLPYIQKFGDGIWSMVVDSIAKPLLYRSAFDIVIGNPPWLRYNMAGMLQRLYEKIWNQYDIKPKPHLRTSYDLAIIFYVASATIYLRSKGIIAFIMPRSIIDGEQHLEFIRKLSNGSISDLYAYAIVELDIDPRDPVKPRRIRKTFKHGMPAIILTALKNTKPTKTHYLLLA